MTHSPIFTTGTGACLVALIVTTVPGVIDILLPAKHDGVRDRPLGALSGRPD